MRLTTTAAGCAFPRISPDGKQVAFVGREDGPPEVYIIRNFGAAPERLTYMGSSRLQVSGWSADGANILFTADAMAPFARTMLGYQVSSSGGAPWPLGLGTLVSVAMSEGGATVIGVNNDDPSGWKRYRGGQAGAIWIDTRRNGTYKRILERLKGNIVAPMFIGNRLYFASDHEGVANIYSCRTNGSDVRKHTHHKEYYVRYPSSDGERIVYTAGADIWVYDPETDANRCLELTVPKMTRQSERKFVPAVSYLETYSPHPEGHSVALIARGQAIVRPNWDGHATQHGAGNKVRYRLIQWLDGDSFVVVNDAQGFERLEIHRADQSKNPVLVTHNDLGRFVEICNSSNLLAFTTHKNNLMLLDLHTKEVQQVDSSTSGQIRDLSWSPDGQWLAYTWPSSTGGASRIRAYNVKTERVQDVTREVLSDRAPTWDPEGKYLYFVSKRTFKPIRDAVKYDLGFVVAEKLCAIALRKDVSSPFLQEARPLVRTDRETKIEALQEVGDVEVDFDGIEDRLICFPDQNVGIGTYAQVIAVKGRVLYVSYDALQAGLEESQNNSWVQPEYPSRHCTLWLYDFEQQRQVFVASDVSQVRLTNKGEFAFFLWGEGEGVLRLFDPLQDIEQDLEETSEPSNEFSRRSGLINLNEIEVSVNPPDEWAQMYHEAWRLQLQHFWDSGMSGVDWDVVRERYSRLLPRIRTRLELSDLICEMQGELGTSHAYEGEGDYPSSPRYCQGSLGAQFGWSAEAGGYEILEILRGEPGNAEADSPLAALGLGVTVGDIILAVDGQSVSAVDPLEKLLVNKGGKKVGILVKDSLGNRRSVTVQTLYSEDQLRYRAWVDTNRRYVHEQTDGKVGYVHVPDMMEGGYAEFFRGYQLEHVKDGLVVDFRYNGGGNVSSLILQVLSRKVVGYDVPRWSDPSTYPYEAMPGPKVGITNQFAGSDGDNISQAFKLARIGPLVGTRTWGGIIGINPTHTLVDGTVTTVPEFAGWFDDVGWDVENHGAEPDYDVEITPADAREGRDPQLDKAIELVLAELEANPVSKPDFTQRPRKPLPFVPGGVATTRGAAPRSPSRKRR
jgi:tricorn protease